MARPREFDADLVTDRALDADFFIGALMGLSAMTRAGRPRTQIKHYIDTALATLD